METCKICGEEKPHDRGMMYCGICSDCCKKNNLCEDCGHPVDDPNVFACSGFHGKIIMTPYMKMQEEHTKEEGRKYQEELQLVRDFLEKAGASEEVKSALTKVARPPRSEWI